MSKRHIRTETMSHTRLPARNGVAVCSIVHAKDLQIGMVWSTEMVLGAHHSQRKTGGNRIVAPRLPNQIPIVMVRHAIFQALQTVPLDFGQRRARARRRILRLTL